MKCSFCNKGIYKKYEEINKRLIIKCNYCGLLKLNKIPDNKSVKRTIKLIERSFFYEYEKEKQSYKLYFNDKLDDIQKYSNGKKLLDIGCSTGIFLNEAEKRGYLGTGYEYSKRAIEMCHRKGLKVFHRDADYLKIIKYKYNVISAFQILEHLRNPGSFISFVKKSLKINGLFLITTPDVNGLVSRISGIRWFGYNNVEHSYFFTVKSLKQYLKNNGFKIIFSKCENGRSLSINYINERLNKYYYFNNKILKILFGIFNILLFPILDWHVIREPYVNIYIIAKKL